MRKADKFKTVPEIAIALYVNLEEGPDLVTIGSGDRRVMLNVQEALMLRTWLNKALPR